MPTYAENAKQREIAYRRRMADARDKEIHAAFDLIAQDNVAKFERPRFSVTGEGAHTAQENYRRNYDRIFPLSARSHRSLLGVSSPPAGVAESTSTEDA